MSRSTDTTPSYSDGEILARDLLASADAIGAMSEDVARARVVISFSSDRCKVALSTATQQALADMTALGLKTSNAAAESVAMASAAYSTAIAVIRDAELLAETTIAKYAAAMCKYEALRSCLSLEKARASIL